MPVRITIEKEDGQLLVKRPTDRGEDRALHGLTRSLVANMVEGVTKGYEKRLEIQGVGYRATMRGTALELSVGYSHVGRRSTRPPGITFEVPVQTEIWSRASTSSWSARSPPRSATCASPSPTRARASATRASTCAGRSGRGRNGDRDRQRGPPAPPQARARKVVGTAERPRLAVFRSNSGIEAQLIDDLAGKTLAAASSLHLKKRSRATRPPRPPRSGRQLAEAAKKAGIEAVVFDRGGYLYHGRVKALADAAREGGLKF